ncbi:MAG: glycosyltransferase family 9 protein [Bacteroidetes bacterium]|nr:glycosyltransferase family 9 protein [Bacteroidota bacterium]
MSERTVLVFRFSSLGDVALTVPVFRTLEVSNPELQILLATQPGFSDLFSTLKNVTVLPADIYGEHKGFRGLIRLYNSYVKHPVNHVVDLHNVLRTKVITTLLKLNKKGVYTYDKQRHLKNDFIKNKHLQASLPHTTSLYLEAFKPLTSVDKIIDGPWISPKVSLNDISRIRDTGLLPKTGKWICVSPFSRHGSKQWVKMKSLLMELAKLENVHLFCLAFGEWESMIAKEWEKDIPGLYLISDGFPLKEQLAFIAAMDAMVSMDSANMHLATLVGTPVVSIWGATHPDMGFAPLNNGQFIVQPDADKTPWRPLSIYGKLKSKEDEAKAKQAMDLIPVEMVYKQTLKAAGLS